MRTSNTTNGSTKPNGRAKPNKQAANDHAANTEQLSAWQRLVAAYDDFVASCGVGTSKRRIIAIVVSVVAYACSAAAALMAADWLITAAVMAGTGTFLTTVLAILAMIATLAIAISAGQIAYDLAMQFDSKALAARAGAFKDTVASGTKTAMGKVAGWFKPSATMTVAAPSKVQ